MGDVALVLSVFFIRSMGPTGEIALVPQRRRQTGSSRKQRAEWSSSFSSLISPTEDREAGASPAEDEDISSSSNFEVKENHEDKIHIRRFGSSTSFSNLLKQRRTALKRKQPSLDGKQRVLTYKRASWTVTQKNALVQLNELKPGLQFQTASESGPLHAPLFSVGVEVNGSRFEGQGPTKKQAKMRAAELALRSFIQFPNAPQAHAAMATFTSAPVDFTANNLDAPDSLLKEFEPSLLENYDLLHCSAAKQEVFSSIRNHRRLVRFTLDLPSSTDPRRRGVSTTSLQQLSPVALLNEMRPGLRYTCLTERVHGMPTRKFVMVVRLEGRIFEGFGPSKRAAKAQAAAAALRSLYSVSLEPEWRIGGSGGSRAGRQLPQFFAESIFHLVREKYAELTDGRCHKVLAGIVMTRGLDLRSAQVVSLATGSRCLESSDMSGCTLSDCHAEVVSRRALVRFLYAQLELLLRSSPADFESRSIFVPGGGDVLRLQDGVLFHMYVSSSPCGDARLNCPYEASAARKKDLNSRHIPPGRRSAAARRPLSAPRWRLRSKVSGGEGTLPVTARTSDHKPLSSMSCTDKMAKWSAVGLQGALLSRLLEPVYLYSLTVGTLVHTGHLSRAMTRRLASADRLPLPYRRRAPLLGCLGRAEVRPLGKAPAVSLNWSLGDAGLEEISTWTGRREASGTPPPSRLCRRSLLERWLRLQRQFNSSGPGAETTTGTYSGYKLAAGRYQRALRQLHAALQAAGLGTWRRKPAELASFSVGGDSETSPPDHIPFPLDSSLLSSQRHSET